MERATSVITDRGGTERPDIRVQTAPQELPSDWVALIAFVADLLVISEWSGVELHMPDTISRETAYTVATVARAIRDGGQQVRWDNLEPTLTAEGLAQLEQGGQLLIEQDLAARIDDQVVDLGFTRLLIKDYRVGEAVEKTDGTYAVRIEPPSEAAAERGSRRRISNAPQEESTEDLQASSSATAKAPGQKT